MRGPKPCARNRAYKKGYESRFRETLAQKTHQNPTMRGFTIGAAVTLLGVSQGVVAESRNGNGNYVLATHGTLDLTFNKKANLTSG